MIWLIGLVLGLIGPLGAEEVIFQEARIWEQDIKRIKATGNLRGNPKLLKVMVRFRDHQVLILGNDYRYGYITVVPYDQIQEMTYSEISSGLHRSLFRSLPLAHQDYAGQEQRWLRMVYGTQEILLSLSKKEAEAFQQTARGKTGKALAAYVDGVEKHPGDVVFRGMKIFRMVEKKGKLRSEDYPCVVAVRGDAFTIVGKDKEFQGRIEVPYVSVEKMAYERAKQSTFMGRMPGVGAFKKSKHWFVIEHIVPDKGAVQTVLLLDPMEVQDFRKTVETKTGKTVDLFVENRSRRETAEPVRVDLGVLPNTPGLLGKADPVEALSQAKVIRCTLGPGYRANWTNGSLQASGSERFNDVDPLIVFEQIDLKEQTAQMRVGKEQVDVRVVATASGWTFLEVTGKGRFRMTTVFPGQTSGRWTCVHSLHTVGIEAGTKSMAGQFYGVAELEE